MENQSNLNIAVVGSGVAGIVSAYLLQKKHQVTLFDKNDYLGGHTHTVVVDHGPDKGLPVDTGFIVFNDRTYPNFKRFIGQLGVEYINSPMSFSYHDQQTKFMYNSSKLFADRRNLLRPSFWRFLKEILKFNKISREQLHTGLITELTLGEFLKDQGFSDDFINWYIIPMGAAIWSTSDANMLDFPAGSFIQFFENHGLLTVNDQPQWHTVKGGSHEYVKAFLKTFQGRVEKSSPVEKIKREEHSVQLLVKDNWLSFDRIIIACHADEALQLLDDPSENESKLLSPWKYTHNSVILHTDERFLPPIKRARGAWNYFRVKDDKEDETITMSYYMNMLQNLDTKSEYMVTLNPRTPINPESIVGQFSYTHPLYNFDAVKTQSRLSELNGQNQTYYCGSYFRYGFHEDAVWSALNVGKHFGISL